MLLIYVDETQQNAPAPNLYAIREAQEQDKGIQLTFRDHGYKGSIYS